MKRVSRIALVDPIEGVGYSRPVRKNWNGKYQEDAQVQALIDDKGVEGAAKALMRRYQGVIVAVLAD